MATGQAKRSEEVTVVATPETRKDNPPWFAEAIVMLKAWVASGFLERLHKEVRLERGRAGTFSVCDFVLMLASYGISQGLTLKAFEESVQSVSQVLMSLWHRQLMPKRSTLSYFLKDMTSACCEALRSLFLPTSWNTGLRKSVDFSTVKVTGTSFSMAMAHDKWCENEGS